MSRRITSGGMRPMAEKPRPQTIEPSINLRLFLSMRNSFGRKVMDTTTPRVLSLVLETGTNASTTIDGSCASRTTRCALETMILRRIQHRRRPLGGPLYLIIRIYSIHMSWFRKIGTIHTRLKYFIESFFSRAVDHLCFQRRERPVLKGSGQQDGGAIDARV